MSEAVKQLFTEISPTYDRLNHLLSFNFDKGWRKSAIRMIRKKRQDHFKAIDLCAGTYDFSLECLKNFPNAEIMACDFSQGMLDAGLNKIDPQIKTGQIKPICCDALHMPFEDNSIDVIFCGYGVRNFDDTEKGMKEIYRVLKPGGQVIVLEFFKPDTILGRFFNRTYAQTIIPSLGKIISKHDSAYSYLRDSIRGFLTTKQFEQMLHKNKFKDIKTKNFIMKISSAVSAFK